MDRSDLQEKIKNTEKEIRELNELLDAHHKEVLKIFMDEKAFKEYLQQL
tara:strand:- start:404 stop:550 length:147 start_codon:yes stop_codon:yes gene_type:complete